MGASWDPRAPDSPPMDPKNAPGSDGRRPGHARTSGDLVGTTTITTPAPTAGKKAAADWWPGRDAEPPTHAWRLLCSRNRMSAAAVLAAYRFEPRAKIGDDVVEILRCEDVETGGGTSCDANNAAPPVCSETRQTETAAVSPAVAAAGAAVSSGVGADLEAAKVSGAEKPVRSVTFLGHLLTMYSDALDKRPVFTKSLSSGLIGLLGDLLAQTVEWGLGGRSAPWNGRRALWRSCAVMLDGFFINGPLLHYCYEFLEKYMPAGKNVFGAVLQVAVDVFIIDPVFGFIFVWSTGLFEGRSVKHDILNTLQHNYPTMVLWLIFIGLAWAPLQVYLFNRYPVQFRVLMADIIDLVWTCVSSFFCHAR